MSDTSNLGLPTILGPEPEYYVTHNEALRLIDSLVQLAVLDRDLATPPSTPSEGERWIVGPSPTDDWIGHADHVAAWQDGAWWFSTPRTGWIAFVVDEGTLLVWNGSAWGDFFSTVTAIQNLALLGVGTGADAGNPFSAKLNNALWVAKTVAEGGDGDLRYKLSKESAANTLSLLFQDNFSGRAEIGLAGDDDFHFKVSADGAVWNEGLIIDRGSGGIRFLAHESDLASSASCNIGAAASLKVQITGTTTITSFGSVANSLKIIRFAGALTLTHHGTSLILPGGANIVTAAGDTCIAVSDASGNWRVLFYQRAAALPWLTGSGAITPALTFGTPGDLSTAYSTQNGVWERIGPQHVRVSLTMVTSTFTHSSASGTALITGLPLAAASITGNEALGAMTFRGITKAGYGVVTPRIQPGGTSITMVASGSGQASATLTAADFPSGGPVIISAAIVYRVA